MVPLFENGAFYVAMEHSWTVPLQSVTCIKEKESRLVGTIGKCYRFPPTVLCYSSIMACCYASLQCGNIFEGNSFPCYAKIHGAWLQEMVVMLGKSSKQYGSCAYLTSTKLAMGAKSELCTACEAFGRACCWKCSRMPAGLLYVSNEGRR